MSYSTRWLLSGFLVVAALLAIVAGFFTLPTDGRFGAAAILVGAGLLAPAAWWLRHSRRGKRVPRTKSASSIGALAIATGLVLFPWSNLSLADDNDTDPASPQASEGARDSAPEESQTFRSSTSGSTTSEESAALAPSSIEREPVPIEPEASVTIGPDVAPSPANSPTSVPSTSAPSQVLPQLPVQTSGESSPQSVVPTPSDPVSPSLSQPQQTAAGETSPSESTKTDRTTPASTEPGQPSDVNDQRAEETEENEDPGGEGGWRFDPRQMIPWLP